MNNTDDEIRMRILKILESTDHEITQREMARHLGISLGKTNYCLAGLIEKGCVRIERFKNSNRKSAYAYSLTPQGIKKKLQLTAKFLGQKTQEYEHLKHEITQLKKEVAEAADLDS